MKRSYLLLLFLFSVIFACKREHILDIDRFTDFYNNNQPDSIYQLFGTEIRANLKPEDNRQFIANLRTQMGEIRFIRNVTASDTINRYRVIFDRGNYDLGISVRKQKIIKISPIAPEILQNEMPESKSFDNFSITNKYGILNGTLDIPVSKDKVPVVVMIVGSGSVDRNLNLKDKRTNAFLILSRFLSTNGIATLRYDKRGVGSSITSQDPHQLIIDDHVGDVKIITAALKQDGRFSKIYLLGHGEGSLIATLAALQIKVDGLISLSGSSLDLYHILDGQLKTAIDNRDYQIAKQTLDSLKVGKKVSRKLPVILRPIFDSKIQQYLISSMKYDPEKELSRLKIPILVIGGSNDSQISKENTFKLAKANPLAVPVIIKGMNHALDVSGLEQETHLVNSNAGIKISKDLKQIIFKFIGDY